MKRASLRTLSRLALTCAWGGLLAATFAACSTGLELDSGSTPPQERVLATQTWRLDQAQGFMVADNCPNPNINACAVSVQEVGESEELKIVKEATIVLSQKDGDQVETQCMMKTTDGASSKCPESLRLAWSCQQADPDETGNLHHQCNTPDGHLYASFDINIDVSVDININWFPSDPERPEDCVEREDSSCAQERACKEKIYDRYIDAVNDQLGDEGFLFKIKPDGLLAKFLATPPAFTTVDLEGICEQEPPKCRLLNRLFGFSSSCYCYDVPLCGPVCNGARILKAAALDLCGQIPTECDEDEFASNLQSVMTLTGRWLAVNKGAKLACIAAATTAAVVAISATAAAAAVTIAVVCDPLVLDLDDDGVRFSSVDNGVVFDIAGHGPTKTAWLADADDALLVIDVNNNGIVDGAGELFGDASAFGGLFMPDDGFKALAALDAPANGGNGDGLVDQDDAMFSQLLVWQDKDLDGISQYDELSTLAQRQISSLSVASTSEGAFIENGNEVALQSSFVRQDGATGSVFEVFLMSGN